MTIPLYTYHCVCSTFLLCTPYALASLPRRAAPALDNAYILPLPPHPSSEQLSGESTSSLDPTPADADPTSTSDNPATGETRGGRILPSLLSENLIAARNIIIIRREDGFERRRVWRCGRCGVGWGYEVESAEPAEPAVSTIGEEGEKRGKGRMRRMFLMEGLRGSEEIEGEVRDKEGEVRKRKGEGEVRGEG